MHIAIKSLIGVTTLGGVATGGYFAFKTKDNKVQNKKNLRDIMKGVADFEPLSTEDGQNAEEWKKMIAKYHEDQSNIEKITVTGIVKPASDEEKANIKKLQKACEELFSKTENFEEDKKIVTNWCNKYSSLIK